MKRKKKCYRHRYSVDDCLKCILSYKNKYNYKRDDRFDYDCISSTKDRY